ncbi:MAG: RNA polymerase sigma factor (sigma-70 family) [Kangiellaceae bacterium]|jgi:RNA polymerase sigma-70 factor (ECF subfamily)
MQNNLCKKDRQFERVFHQFIQNNRPRLLAYTLRLLPAAEAEEVIQDAHIKFYCIALAQRSAASKSEQQATQRSADNKAKGDKTPGTVISNSQEIDLAQYTPLLFSIAKNLSLSLIRHKQVISKHQQKTNEDTNQQSICFETSMLEREEKDRLRQAIENLPHMCRQVFIQRKIQNMSHNEIASMFNISTKTVESHIARGLKLCRQFMISSRSTSISTNASLKPKQQNR